MIFDFRCEYVNMELVNYSEEMAIVRDVKGGWRHVKTIKLFYNFIVKEGEGFPGTNTDIEEEICTIFIIIYNMCWNFCHLLVKFKTARFHLLALNHNFCFCCLSVKSLQIMFKSWFLIGRRTNKNCSLSVIRSFENLLKVLWWNWRDYQNISISRGILSNCH